MRINVAYRLFFFRLCGYKNIIIIKNVKMNFIFKVPTEMHNLFKIQTSIVEH